MKTYEINLDQKAELQILWLDDLLKKSGREVGISQIVRQALDLLVKNRDKAIEMGVEFYHFGEHSDKYISEQEIITGPFTFEPSDSDEPEYFFEWLKQSFIKEDESE